LERVCAEITLTQKPRSAQQQRQGKGHAMRRLAAPCFLISPASWRAIAALSRTKISLRSRPIKPAFEAVVETFLTDAPHLVRSHPAVTDSGLHRATITWFYVVFGSLPSVRAKQLRIWFHIAPRMC